jgi:hypothetical protein
MPLRRTLASGVTLMSTGGTIRLPRVKLPPAPQQAPLPAPEAKPEPLPAAPADEREPAQRVLILGQAGSPQVLETMKELVEEGVSFAYCDAEREPVLLAELTRICGPLEMPAIVTVRLAPDNCSR